MRADRYHGAAARNYDRTRVNDGTWRAEHAMIDKLVTAGPVLDVPFGTGRYVPIYEEKGLRYLGIDISQDMIAQARSKHPDATVRVGTVFDLPTGYETAVCSRLLNWLYPDQLRKAMGQLGQSAETLIFTLRSGTDGDRRATATYTHSTDTLKGLIGPRLWEQHHIGGLKHGEYIMVKARRPEWADVEAAFSRAPGDTIDKLVGHWAARIKVERPQLTPDTPLTVEWWTHQDLGAYVDQIARTDPGMVVTRKPRREDGPLIAFKRDGRHGLVDGRCRANLWRDRPGVYPVIVAEC